MNSTKRFALYLVMALIVIVMVLPFAWMLSTSLKSQEFILQTTPQLIPDPITVESYVQLAERIEIFRIFWTNFP